MNVSVSNTTIITAIIMFSILAVFIILYMKRKRQTFSKIEVLSFLALCMVINVRLFLPLEFPFTYSLYIGGIYFNVCNVVDRRLYHSVTIGGILLTIELLGALLIGAYKIFNYIRLVRLAKSAEFVKTLEISKYKKVYIYSSKIIREPFIMGIWKTMILLPKEKLVGIDYIIEHEIQHYKNHDLHFKLLFEIISVIYWWNPLIYVIKRYFYNMMELHNDFSITKRISEEQKISYAATLLEAAKFKHNTKFGIGINSQEGFLKYRVYSIFEKKNSKGFIFLLVLMIFSFISFFVVIEPYNTPSMTEEDFLMQDDKMYFIRKSAGYCLVVDGKEVGLLEEIPEELKNITILEEK